MFGFLSYEILVFFITLLLLYVYLKISFRFHWFDQPDEDRKIHAQVKPTSAGLIFMLPIVVFLLWIPVSQPINARIIAILLLVLMLLGGYDDFKPLAVKFKFPIIVVVCFYFIYSVFGLNTISIALFLFYGVGLIWWLNLYNFMDGSDGMAIWQALIPMLGYTVLYTNFNDSSAMMVPYLLLIMLCFIAFLVFNFPKAKMFMGDSGSLSVAFLLAAFAIYGIAHEYFGEILVLSFHLVFVLDASLTLLTRIKFKHNIGQAHRLHLYQQLIHRGLSHAMVSVLYALFTLVLVIIALYSHYWGGSFAIKVAILLAEIVFLSFLWFYLQNKTKFKQFKR